MQRAVGKYAAVLSSHHRVHAGSVFGSRCPALEGHTREGAQASQRMLVFDLISAHANIYLHRFESSDDCVRSAQWVCTGASNHVGTCVYVCLHVCVYFFVCVCV